jgi:molybdenum cofactor cytidylyltransferase
MIAGIILAAGASSRMGSPKALLEYKGELFVNRLIRILGAVADPVIVVLGYHAGAIRPKIDRRATIVINPAPERGQLSSFQTALHAIPRDAEGVLFTTVDCPAVHPETVTSIVTAFEQREPGKFLAIPRVNFHGEMKRGHPVCATRQLIGEFLALPADSQAKNVIHRHIPDTVYVDVDDPGILADVDDPEGYRRLIESASSN